MPLPEQYNFSSKKIAAMNAPLDVFKAVRHGRVPALFAWASRLFDPEGVAAGGVEIVGDLAEGEGFGMAVDKGHIDAGVVAVAHGRAVGVHLGDAFAVWAGVIAIFGIAVNDGHFLGRCSDLSAAQGGQGAVPALLGAFVVTDVAVDEIMAHEAISATATVPGQVVLTRAAEDVLGTRERLILVAEAAGFPVDLISHGLAGEECKETVLPATGAIPA